MVGYLKIVKDKLRGFRNFIKKHTFRLAEKHLRTHITPVHFYSPIPNINELKSDIFTRVHDCVGLDWNIENQLSYFQLIFPKYIGEYIPPINQGLSQVDAFVLYAMIRGKKPKVLIEIGSGESTKISLSALGRNEDEGIACHFTAIEPFPKVFLKEIRNKSFELIESKVQDIDIEFLSQADILFIDSSHVAKIGSDVNYEILNIVPRLKVGSLVHWHDIMIPIDYPKGWIENGNMFWNESYMIHAFILHNKCFRVIWASKYMQLNYSDQLHNIFPYFHPEDPDQQLSSFWIERVS